MTNPTPSNSISHHLTDSTGTPLLSSSQTASHISQSQSQALSSLTSAAMSVYDTASRLGLGLPQRVLIETSSRGPVVLHSYLNSQSSQITPTNGRGIVEQAREDLRPLSGTTESSSLLGRESEAVNGMLVNGANHSKDAQEVNGAQSDDGPPRQTPPMLVATVVAASATEAIEARRVAARLERMGSEFQSELIGNPQVHNEPSTGGGEEG